jgi:hypothetical protein
MIIGINGYAKSGKDTAALLILHILQEHKDGKAFTQDLTNLEDDTWYMTDRTEWNIRKFAEALKRISAILLNVRPHKLEKQEFKDSLLGPEWENVTVREFLQTLGTEVLRTYNPDIWVNTLFNQYNNNNWIITDLRYPNEADAIKSRSGINIRINREGVKPTNSHISEVILDDYPFDFVVENNSSLEDFREELKKILKQCNII